MEQEVYSTLAGMPPTSSPEIDKIRIYEKSSSVDPSVNASNPLTTPQPPVRHAPDEAALKAPAPPGVEVSLNGLVADALVRGGDPAAALLQRRRSSAAGGRIRPPADAGSGAFRLPAAPSSRRASRDVRGFVRV